MDWRAFWNEDHAIYVSPRHRALHAALVAEGVVGLLPPGQPHVLDWGCGEALGAGQMASRCDALYLYDSAPRVQAGLRSRFADSKAIIVVDEEALARLPPQSLDAIAIVSVVQYLSREMFDTIVASLVPKLATGGRLIVGDVIPPNLSPLVDAAALLRFAWRGGFFAAAIVGLFKTAFGHYRTVRAKLGLTSWSEAEMVSCLHRHGLVAQRARKNIGHNEARMTFVATRGVG